MLERLRGLPRLDSLKSFLEKLLRCKGDRVVSVVLFGSMAKGSYTVYSDYDLLIVSRETAPFKDRLYEYSLLSDGWVEPLIYTEDEVESMVEDGNPLILDALRDGVVLYDKRFWSRVREEFNELLRSGVIKPKRNGWMITYTKLGAET